MRRFSALLVLLGLSLACGPGHPLVLGGARTPIIGGEPDPEHPAVVAIVIGGQYGMGLCSGTLITPRIVLTAAHCVVEDGSGSPQGVVFGSDLDTGDWVSVTNYAAHPDYNPYGGGGYGVHDIGVVVLDSPGPVSPAPYRIEPLEGLEGAPIVFVGFGETESGDSNSVGVKYMVGAVIGSIEPQGIWNYTTPADPKNTCNGDSGGPAFLLGGRTPPVISVTSSGDWYCNQDGWNTRVDANADWLAEMIALYDPGNGPEAAEPQGGEGDDAEVVEAITQGETHPDEAQEADAIAAPDSGLEEASSEGEGASGEGEAGTDGLSPEGAEAGPVGEDGTGEAGVAVEGTAAGPDASTAEEASSTADADQETVGELETDGSSGGCSATSRSVGPAPFTALIVALWLLVLRRRLHSW